MAMIHSDEFKRDAVRIATTSGQTRRQVASDLGVGFSTLNKWVKMVSDEAGPPGRDQNLLRENERLRRENRILKEEREQLKKTLEDCHGRCRRAKRGPAGVKVSVPCALATMVRLPPLKPHRDENALRQTLGPVPHGAGPRPLGRRVPGSYCCAERLHRARHPHLEGRRISLSGKGAVRLSVDLCNRAFLREDRTIKPWEQTPRALHQRQIVAK